MLSLVSDRSCSIASLFSRGNYRRFETAKGFRRCRVYRLRRSLYGETLFPGPTFSSASRRTFGIDVYIYCPVFASGEVGSASGATGSRVPNPRRLNSRCAEPAHSSSQYFWQRDAMKYGNSAFGDFAKAFLTVFAASQLHYSVSNEAIKPKPWKNLAILEPMLDVNSAVGPTPARSHST
jgi:hypothetical protein